MGYPIIVLISVITNMCVFINCEVVISSSQGKAHERYDYSIAQKLLNLDKKFEEKINKLNDKFSVLEKTVSQLKAVNKDSPSIKRGFGPPIRGLTNTDDCTVEDEKALVGKPVCNYNNCEDWSPWGPCDLENRRQIRNRLCHSKYMKMCPSKTESEIRQCNDPCDFKNCSHWSPWNDCEVLKLGEHGTMVRSRNCWSNSGLCNISAKTETESKSCEPDCKVNECTEWSDWSKCDSQQTRKGSSKKRARKCGIDSEICNSKLQTQVGVCDNNCPDSYVKTSYETCIKYFYKHETWYDAEEVCQQDGGHLIHLDNPNKTEEAKKLFSNLWTGFWIDGIKHTTEGNWLFRNGNSTFTAWSAGEPRQGQSHARCVYVDHQKWRWHTFNCLSLGNFMCEMSAVEHTV